MMPNSQKWPTTFNLCQSGEISQNPVTLMAAYQHCTVDNQIVLTIGQKLDE